MRTENFILNIYRNRETVFTMKDIALVQGATNYSSLKQMVNYYVRQGVLSRIRNGIYVKENYNVEEMVCKLFPPSYISLEYVLRKSGVIFQYSEAITAVSYLNRSIEVDSKRLSFRRIKGEILVNTLGIERREDGVNIATPERAMLDLLYLEKEYYFDNLSGINIDLLNQIQPIYNSKQLCRRVKLLIDKP